MDFAEQWRTEAKLRRAPDSVEAWDARALDQVSKYVPGQYSRQFLELADLEPGQSVFDMGCGAGSLAIPCAEAGHAVLACDFSKEMLRRLEGQLGAGTRPLVETKLLGWEDDWDAAGVAPKSYDVAFASRSIITMDLEESLAKLCGVARERVCVTVIAGQSPRIAPAMFADLRIPLRENQDASFVYGVAAQMGYRPEVSYIVSERVDSYDSPEEAYESYGAMLEFAELSEADGAEKYAQAVRSWVDGHLVQVDGKWKIDVPRRFCWSFLSWELPQ